MHGCVIAVKYDRTEDVRRITVCCATPNEVRRESDRTRTRLAGWESRSNKWESRGWGDKRRVKLSGTC